MPKHTVEYWEFKGLRISRHGDSIVFEERSTDCLGKLVWQKVGAHPVTSTDKDNRKSVFIGRLSLALLKEYGQTTEWEDHKEPKANV